MSSLAITILVLHVLLQCWRKSRLMCEGTVRMKLFKRDRGQLGTVLDMDICRVRCAMANIKKATRIPIENCLQECSRSLKTGSDSGLKDDLGKRSRRSVANGTKSNTNKPVLKRTEEPTLQGVEVENRWIFPEGEDMSGIKLKTSMTEPPGNEKILNLWLAANNASESCKETSHRKNDKTLTASSQNTSLPLSVNVTFIGGNKTWHAMASWKFNLTVSGRVLRNVTGYMVFWNTDSSTDLKCRRLPQNQTMVNISDADGWSYPEVLYLTVQPIPYVKGKDLKLISYSPKALSDETRLSSTYLPTLSDETRLSSTNLPNKNLTPGHIGAICVGIIVGVALVTGLFLRVRQIGSRSTKPRSEVQVFVSYSRADYKWVNENLLRLMDRHNITYLIDYKDFEPGRPWIETMVDCIQRSHKVLVIMSQEYMSRKNCQAELQHAMYWARGGKRLVVLRINNVDKGTLPGSIRNRTFIDYADMIERQTWKKRLVNILKTARLSNQSQISINFSSSDTSCETKV